MLGEQISEGRGKRGIRRVIATDPHFKVETSFEDQAKVLGVDGMNIGTYVAYTKPDGSLHGDGEGVFASADGGIMTWKGSGAGRLNADGSVSYRGALSFTTTAAKLTRLNSIAGVFEFEVDPQGNTHSKIWEWK